MKNTSTSQSICKIILAASTLTVLAGCGDAITSGGGGSSIAISGSLSLGNSGQAAQKLGLNFSTKSMLLTDDSLTTQSVDLTQYTATCATATPPIKSGTSAVAANGSFSIDIAGATGQPLSCYLVDASGNRAADFIISDSSKKDLNGANQISGTAAFAKNADLGTISFDPNAGEVTVPLSNIAASVTTAAPASAVVFDPTGSWTIGSVDYTLPSGVNGPCPAGSGGGGGGNSCNGPAEGMQLYLKMWKGIQTSDNSDIFGLQLWQGQSKFNSCGGKIGLTPAIKTQLGVDFSANGSADSIFSFASTVPSFHDQISGNTSTVTITEDWKMSTAKLRYDIQPNCGPRDIVIGGVTYSNAWTCGPDSNTRYQVQLGGGCFDTAGAPVQLTDWSGMTGTQPQIDSAGIRTMSVSGSKNINGTQKTVTCSNKWAVTNSSYVVQTSPSVDFTWNDLNSTNISATSSPLCSAISTSAPNAENKKMAQLRCYADYYYQSGMQESNVCLPKVDMDWSATTSAAFAVVDKIRPNGLIFFEQFKPFADGSGGTMVTRQEHYEGVQVGSSWVNCRVIETGGLTIKKISETKLLANYQESLITTSTSKPACLAQFTGSRKTFSFYLNK